MTQLAIGQEIPLSGRLRMGLGWDQAPNAGALSSGGRHHVDLDASAVEFGGGDQGGFHRGGVRQEAHRGAKRARILKGVRGAEQHFLSDCV